MPGIRGIVENLRTSGLKATLGGIAAALKPRRFGVYMLEPQQCPGGTSPFPLEDLGRARNAERKLETEFYADVRGASNTCFVAVHDDRLAGIAWILDCNHSSRFIALADGEVEISYLLVRSDFRGRSIARTLIHQACGWARNQGIRRVYAVIRRGNFSSEKVFARVGFKKVAELHRPGVIGFRYASNRTSSLRQASDPARDEQETVTKG